MISLNCMSVTCRAPSMMLSPSASMTWFCSALRRKVTRLLVSSTCSVNMFVSLPIQEEFPESLLDWSSLIAFYFLVWIGIAQCIHNIDFQCFHLFSCSGFLVVKTLQM